jgi:hypothetical protein
MHVLMQIKRAKWGSKTLEHTGSERSSWPRLGSAQRVMLALYYIIHVLGVLLQV